MINSTTIDATAPRTRLRGRAAIFDLDRTIVPGSSLVDLARVLCADGLVGRWAVAGRMVAATLFARRGAGDRQVERAREAALMAIAGCQHAVFVEAARRAGTAVAERAYPGARWLLERHLEAGDFCVILSAAPQELVEAVAVRLGAHRAVGSRGTVVDGRFTGELEGAFCYGDGKLTRLATEVGPVDLPGACAYADSGSDLPLLQACGRPVAVNPDRRLRREAAKGAWPVLRFS